MSLFQDEADPLTWLTQLIGPMTLASGEEAAEWVIFRGNAARNAESVGGFPLLTARWRVRAANHPGDEEMIRQQWEAYENQGVAAIPGLQPLAVANVVLMREPQRLVAVDLETGKRIWNFPWFESSEEEPPQQIDQFRSDRRQTNPFSLELQQRVWDDAPTAR